MVQIYIFDMALFIITIARSISFFEMFKWGLKRIERCPHPKIKAPSSSTLVINLSRKSVEGRSNAQNNPLPRTFETKLLSSFWREAKEERR